MQLNVLNLAILIFGLIGYCQCNSCTNATNNLITKWMQSTGVGYGNYTADIVSLSYDSTYVYITANSIPQYTIGTWNRSRNLPLPMNYTRKFSLNPAKAASSNSLKLGPIGLYINGLYAYASYNTESYNSQGIWLYNAYYMNGVGFDECGGHPGPTGAYHNHVNPSCLYSTTNSTYHSPLIGFALDSFPIYGIFGYSSANESDSTIKRMSSSYQLRDITERTSIVSISGATTELNSSVYGPSVSESELGTFVQDYVYTADSGDLDANNGRWCVTPEYPNGTYAYFITTDTTGYPAYPYTIGAYYYGTPIYAATATVSSTAIKCF